jgi:hypothetical protein
MADVILQSKESELSFPENVNVTDQGSSLGFSAEVIAHSSAEALCACSASGA